MTMMPQDMRTLILGSTSVAALVVNRVHYNKDVPQVADKPFVWFRTTADDEPLTMDGVGGMHEAYVDIECVGLSESSVQDVADAVKGRLHGYSGAMGNISAKGIFIASKDDDYVPFSIEGEEGEHVVAYEAHLWYTT